MRELGERFHERQVAASSQGTNRGGFSSTKRIGVLLDPSGRFKIRQLIRVEHHVIVPLSGIFIAGPDSFVAGGSSRDMPGPVSFSRPDPSAPCRHAATCSAPD